LAKRRWVLTLKEKYEGHSKRRLPLAGVNVISIVAKNKYLAKTALLMKTITMEIPERVSITTPSTPAQSGQRIAINQTAKEYGVKKGGFNGIS
jgi:hypothetical protein